MTAKTHEMGAVAGLMVAMAYFGIPKMSTITICVALIANLVGSLLPDIDQNQNRLWDMIPGGNTIGKVAKKVFWGHRSLSHSILGTFLVYFGLKWLLPKIFNKDFIDTNIILISLVIGFVSHLGLDFLTQEGLPLFFPLKWKLGFPPFKKLRIRTGRFVENWLVFPILLAILIGLVVYLVSKQYLI